jgi:hypothetical protein
MKHGGVDAEIYRAGVLSIEELGVDPEWRGKGIATLLIRSTIRGANQIAGDRPLQAIEANIINPIAVKLVHRLLGTSVEYFMDNSSRKDGTNSIDYGQAIIETTTKQQQVIDFSTLNEYPEGFEPGIYARAMLNPELVQSWPLPEFRN